MADFRSASGSASQWFPTNGTFSNFEFVDTRFRSHSILRRILSLGRKLDYKGLLVEEILEADCALLAAENQALATRLPSFQSSRVSRLSLFANADQAAPGEFLGYVIHKEDMIGGNRVGHVYEAVIKPPRRHRENNFIHCQRAYRVSTSLGHFQVNGVLFAQQNDATFVCAHVALRSMLATLLPAADVSYQRINQLAGVDHTNPATRVGEGGNGLNPSQVEAVLRGCGFTPELVVHEPGNQELPPHVEFQRLLYGYLESNQPLLLGFELAPHPHSGEIGRHIIPVFGHTFNEDLWVPEAERNYFAHNRGYFPSESWLSSYVAHDDNFGPYVCLPRHYLHRDAFRLLIGLHPAGVTLPPDEAEVVAFDFASQVANAVPFSGIAWLDRFASFCRSDLLVLRTFALNRSDYIAHLRHLRDREGFDLETAIVDRFAAHLPDPIWVVELSAPELFPASRRKFGEILVTASAANPGGLPQIVGARVPGAFYLVQAGNFLPERTRLAGHTELYSYSTS
jgi:hypothetical protein